MFETHPNQPLMVRKMTLTWNACPNLRLKVKQKDSKRFQVHKAMQQLYCSIQKHGLKSSQVKLQLTSSSITSQN